MDAQVTYLCAYVGTKWPPVWVERLYRMLEAKSSVPFDFRVITDKPDMFPEWGVQISRPVVPTVEVPYSKYKDGETLWLHSNKPMGCWAKLDAFLPKWGSNPIICFDLDVTIVGDPYQLVRKELHMAAEEPERFNRAPNGSIYSYTPGYLPEDFDVSIIPWETRRKGEQEWVAEKTGAKLFESGTYSFKHHIACRGGKIPPDTIVVFHHGFPTPAHPQVRQLDWAAWTWKNLEPLDRDKWEAFIHEGI